MFFFHIETVQMLFIAFLRSSILAKDGHLKLLCTCNRRFWGVSGWLIIWFLQGSAKGTHTGGIQTDDAF